MPDQNKQLQAANISVLAVGAHPDDIELGCGGTIAKLVRAGAQVRAVIFSKGRRGSIPDEDRTLESREAFATLGVTDVVTYDFEDTQLWRSVNDMIDVLDGHVETLRPDRIYTMFQMDRHQDHRAVYDASVVAGRKVRKLLGYETPSSYPNFMPTVFEPIENYLEMKVKSLTSHKSQGARLYMQEEKNLSAANFRGVQVDMGPCEGFVPYKMIL